MNHAERKEIESKVLDMVQSESFQAEFYLHEAIDPNNETIERAKERANQEAERRSNITGKIVEPNYTPDNLIRLGAEQRKHLVPWVKIKRLGAVDYKSYEVIDAHKETYPDQWAQFEEKHSEYFKDIRERRDNLRAEENGQLNNTQGSNWQGGGVSYTPTAYTVSWG